MPWNVVAYTSMAKWRVCHLTQNEEFQIFPRWLAILSHFKSSIHSVYNGQHDKLTNHCGYASTPNLCMTGNLLQIAGWIVSLPRITFVANWNHQCEKLPAHFTLFSALVTHLSSRKTYLNSILMSQSFSYRCCMQYSFHGLFDEFFGIVCFV